MRHLIIALLALTTVALILGLAAPAVAEVPQAEGKILIYLYEARSERYYQDVMVFIVNESTIYINYPTSMWSIPHGLLLISYDSNNKVLIIDGCGQNGCPLPLFFIYSPAYPASFIKAMPSLDRATMKLILPNGSATTSIIDFTRVSVKEIKYEGYNAVEISYQVQVNQKVDTVRIIYRGDGILLLYEYGGESNRESMKLVAEDDIAKKTTKQITGIATQSPTETPTPTSTPVITTTAPTTPMQTSATATQQTLTPTQSIQATTVPQETGVRLEYIVVGVAVIVVAVAAILTALKKR